MDETKDVKPELPKNVKELYTKGLEALKRLNFAYAVELFEQVLAYKPDYAEARHQLRVAEKANFRKNPPFFILSLIQKIFSYPTIFKARLLEAKGKTKEAINKYESLLKVNPINEGVLQKIALCFLKLEMKDTAIKTLEEIRDINPVNIIALKGLGKLYTEKGKYLEAQNCFEKVLQVRPSDLGAEHGLKNLAALGTIKRGGWEEETDFREKIEDKTKAKRLEKEERTVKTEKDISFLIEEAKKQITSEGETPTNLKKLAELQTKANQIQEALEIYQKLAKLSPHDGQLQQKILNLKLILIDRVIIEVEKKLKRAGLIDKKTGEDKIASLEKEKSELTLEILKQRVSQFPNDLNLRYEYGKALYETGHINEAIPHLQASVDEPIRKIDSLNLLGLAFKDKKMLDLSLTQLKKAYQSIPQGGRQGAKEKEIIYNLAQLYEEMGKKDLAIQEYKKIYESDITYKDVAKKIEENYKSKD